MIEIGKELNENTCCMCLSEEESTFKSTSTFRSHPIPEMVDFCIGIQLNNITDGNQMISKSICSECVLNVSNFYTFKKKILEAQDFLGALSVIESESTDEKSEEIDNYVAIEGTDDLIQILEEEHLRPSDVNETEEYIVESDSQPSNESSEQIQVVDKNQRKRYRSSDKNSTQTNNKRTKASCTDSTEKITIQMNECLICPAVLNDIHQLDNHITAHKDIICKGCLRAFARYSNLKRHFMLVHSKPKPFQCDLCGLGFSFSVNLQAHAELHYSGKIRMK